MSCTSLRAQRIRPGTNHRIAARTIGDVNAATALVHARLSDGTGSSDPLDDATVRINDEHVLEAGVKPPRASCPCRMATI